jgi:hypothetical protein
MLRRAHSATGPVARGSASTVRPRPAGSSSTSIVIRRRWSSLPRRRRWAGAVSRRAARVWNQRPRDRRDAYRGGCKSACRRGRARGRRQGPLGGSRRPSPRSGGGPRGVGQGVVGARGITAAAVVVWSGLRGVRVAGAAAGHAVGRSCPRPGRRLHPRDAGGHRGCQCRCAGAATARGVRHAVIARVRALFPSRC